MDKIILVGAGGHARSCIDVLEIFGKFSIAGFIEKDKSLTNSNLGYPIIGTDNDLNNLRREFDYALITVGQLKSPAIRVKLFNLLNENKKNIQNLYFKERLKKTKQINKRTKINYFGFHISNPWLKILRNFFLKRIVENKNFIKNYLGKIYK